jgi:protein TonB
MTTLTMGNFPQHSNNTTLTYGGLSILVHLILLGALSLLHHEQEIEKPVPLVQVTLVETSSGSSNDSSNETPPKTEPLSDSPPPQLKSQRTATPINRTLIPLPKPLTPPILMKDRISPIPPPVPKSVSPIKRPVLQDTQATNVLAMKNLLKVVPISNPTVTSRKETPRLDIPFSQPQPWTQPVPAINSQSSSTTSKTPSTSKRAMLMAHPPGMGKVGSTKIGLGHTIPPIYPRVAREQGWEGTVRLRVTVFTDGQPGDIIIRKSSGHTILDNAAITAVRSWRFQPARDGNIPIKSIVDIPINFDLRKQG